MYKNIFIVHILNFRENVGISVLGLLYQPVSIFKLCKLIQKRTSAVMYLQSFMTDK